MFNLLPIPFTLTLITKYWNDAEAELRSAIEKKYHDLDEEVVTKLFFCEFAFLLHQANQNKEFGRAFLADLRRAFPEAQSFHLSSFSPNLIADVSLHKHHEEAITGGDFGLTITRPQITWAGPELVRSEYCRGLLVQAKIKRRNGKWGPLKGRQKDVFSERMKYLSLLLYSYSDVERRCLEPFSWQLCRDATKEIITKDWLKEGKFPSRLSSADAIKQLGNAQKETEIGTGDPKIIETFIRTKGKPYLEIRIFWRDKFPPKRVYVGIQNRGKIAQKVPLKIRG